MRCDIALLTMHLDRWLSADEEGIEREARALAERWPARQVAFRSVRTLDYAGQPARSVVFDIGGSEFALVPAGSYAIGFDIDAYDAGREVQRSYAAAVRNLGCPRSLAAYLREVLVPPSRVEVPAMLVEVNARRAGYVPVRTDTPQIAKLLARIQIRGSYEESGRFLIEERDGAYAAWVIRSVSREELVRALASTGFRLPTASEWEVACSAGRPTLFRWGDTCPLDCAPVDEVIYHPKLYPGIAPFGLHVAPNAWGLRIAEDPYRTELVVEPGVLRGGDGGTAICGGYGAFLEWLPLASAYAGAEQSRQLVDDGATGHWYRRVLEVP